MIYNVVAFFLALIPFTVWMGCGDGIRTPKEIASVLGLITIIAVASLYPKKKVALKWLWFFWAWCGLSLIFNNYTLSFLIGWAGHPTLLVPHPDMGITGIPSVFLAWKEIFYISLSVMTIYSLASMDTFNGSTLRLFNTQISFHPTNVRLETRSISNLITNIVIIMCVYSIIQAIGLDNFFRVTNNQGLVAPHNTGGFWHFHHRVVGTLGNPSILAIWLSILTPFSLYLKNKKGYVALGLIILTLIMAKSSMAWLALFSAVTFWFLIKHKRLLPVAVITFIILSSVLFINRNSEVIKDYCGLTGRVAVHKEAWKILQDRPLLGMGLGTFEYMIGLNPSVVERLKDESWKELHDEYGQVWWSLGLVGLLLFLAFAGSIFLQFFKNTTDESLVYMSSMVGFLVLSIAHFPMRIAPQSFYGVIFTGLLLNCLRREG